MESMQRANIVLGPVGLTGIQALVHTSGICQLPTRTCLGPNVNLDSPLPESGRRGLEVNVCF